MRAGLEEALARHATFAEAADAASPVAAVMAAAPDLVVLVGDAVRDHEAILKKLAGNALTSVVPVVLLTPGGLDVQLSAARRGVAVVRRTASVDEMAGRIAQLARELPERPAKTGGSVEEATLGELLEIVQRELQGGILSVTQEGGEGSARFVLKPGRNVDAAIRDFVRRIKPLLQQEKPLHYELDDPGTGKLAVLDEGDVGDRGVFKGRRVLLVEDDAAAADALAQELRAHGATVAVCTSAGGGLERARTLDPEVVLIDEAALDGSSATRCGLRGTARGRAEPTRRRCASTRATAPPVAASVVEPFARPPASDPAGGVAPLGRPEPRAPGPRPPPEKSGRASVTRARRAHTDERRRESGGEMDGACDGSDAGGDSRPRRRGPRGESAGSSWAWRRATARAREQGAPPEPAATNPPGYAGDRGPGRAAPPSERPPGELRASRSRGAWPVPCTAFPQSSG